MNISKENIDELNAVLKLTVEKTDYEPKVNDVLKDYRKKVNMPGFRAGKVPAGLVKKMYGKAIIADEVNKIVSQEISKYIEENKLNVLGEPIPSEDQELIDFDTQDTFNFSFDFAIAPEVDVKLSKRDKLPYYLINVDDELIDRQVEMYCGRYGANNTVEVASEKSMIKGSFYQLDAEGNAIEEGVKTEGVVVSAANIKDEEQKAKLIGAKAGDVIVLTPSEAFADAKEIASTLKISEEVAEDLTSDFQFTVTEVNEFAAAELNQELFDQVYGEGKISTPEEFRAKVKEEIQGTLVYESDYRFNMDAKEKVMSKIDISLPEAFLKRWLTLVNQGKEGVDADVIEKEMPLFIEDLKWQLVKNTIIKANEIKIEEADVVEQAKKSAKMQFMQYGLSNIPDEHLTNYANDMLKNQEQSKTFVENAVQEKVFDFIKEAVKVEDKEISREDFNKLFEKN